jgi:hypothetical protein
LGPDHLGGRREGTEHTDPVDLTRRRSPRRSARSWRQPETPRGAQGRCGNKTRSRIGRCSSAEKAMMARGDGRMDETGTTTVFAPGSPLNHHETSVEITAVDLELDGPDLDEASACRIRSGFVAPDRRRHWITSSARSSRDCGIVSPSALAVLRLMTNSNFVGRSIGRSAGLAPLRILPVKEPRRPYPSARLGP